MTRTSAHPPAATARLALAQAVARRAGLRARFTGAASRQLWAQAALVWLLLALVVVPTVGRLHQVIHAPALQVHALSPSAGFADPGDSHSQNIAGPAAAGTPTAQADDPAAGHNHPAHASLVIATHDQRVVQALAGVQTLNLNEINAQRLLDKREQL